MARISMNKTAGSSRTSSSQDQLEAVRKKAFELYEKRGRKTGRAMDDWLEAERLVKQKMF